MGVGGENGVAAMDVEHQALSTGFDDDGRIKRTGELAYLHLFLRSRL